MEYISLSSEQAIKKQFPAIDILKFILAILVITIHTTPLADVDFFLDYGLSKCIARIAVPFYFVAGGYFCFRKTRLVDFDIAVPMTHARKMLMLYIIWTGIYIAQAIWGGLNHEGGIFIGMLSTFVLVGYHHLWYLLAAAFAFAVVGYALYKRIGIGKIVFAGFLLYLVGLLGDSYFGLLRPLQGTFIWSLLKLYGNVFSTTRNGLFEGVLFVGIGAAFAYKRIDIKKNVAIASLIISILCLLGEAYLIRYLGWNLKNNLYLFLVPTTFFLFYVASHIEVQSSKITKTLRSLSSLIYFIHPWINFPGVTVLNVVCKKIVGAGEYSIHSLLRFFVVFLGAVIMSVIVLRLQEHERFKWLRKIY